MEIVATVSCRDDLWRKTVKNIRCNIFTSTYPMLIEDAATTVELPISENADNKRIRARFGFRPTYDLQNLRSISFPPYFDTNVFHLALLRRSTLWWWAFDIVDQSITGIRELRLKHVMTSQIWLDKRPRKIPMMLHNHRISMRWPQFRFTGLFRQR